MGRLQANGLSPIELALELSPPNYLSSIRKNLLLSGMIDAVAFRRTAAIFDWVMSLLSLQGISDRAAIAFMEAHGKITWSEIQADLQRACCPRLSSWWVFKCRFRKAAQTCASPLHRPLCPLPQYDLRKGSLNQAAFGFALFLRDVCDGDFVGWLDARLEQADPGLNVGGRGRRLCEALIKPLSEIPGTGAKVWSLVLADVLLGADPERQRWTAAGAAMIVVDSLTHNFLHRTGLLSHCQAEHAYGPQCYLEVGCVGVIDVLSRDIDARKYDGQLPSYCPRFVQHAVWHFCAEAGRAICNGREIDDRQRCRQVFCPAFEGCERLVLHPP